MKSRIQKNVADEKNQNDDEAVLVSLLRAKFLAKLEKADEPKQDIVYQNLIALAELYPLSNVCCFSGKELSKGDKFFLASGYVCNAEKFKEYLLNDNANLPEVPTYDFDKASLITHFDAKQRRVDPYRSLFVGVTIAGLILSLTAGVIFGAIVGGPAGAFMFGLLGAIVGTGVGPLLGILACGIVALVNEIKFAVFERSQQKLIQAKAKPRFEKSTELLSVATMVKSLDIPTAAVAATATAASLPPVVVEAAARPEPISSFPSATLTRSL